MRAVAEPVIHQQFQITRLKNGQLATVDLPRDLARPEEQSLEAGDRGGGAVSGVLIPKAPASRNRPRQGSGAADHPVIHELQSVLKSNDLHQNPVSVSAFAAWRSKLKNPVREHHRNSP